MTEFMQPNRPLRIKVNITGETITHQVFAIGISNGHDIEYLTVDGLFIPADRAMFAETLINGMWQGLTRNSNPDA